MICLEGSVGFQAKPRKLCEEYITVFSIRVRHQSDKVEPTIIVVDREKWEVSRNRLPPWHHNIDMQTAKREQVDALLHLGVIEVSHAPIWSQVHIVPKPDGKWRFALDFIRLIVCTGALEVWPIPNISYSLKRIGDTDVLSRLCTNLIEVVTSLGKLVTEKPVDFVDFDNVVKFNKNRQNDDNVVKAYKANLVGIHLKRSLWHQLRVGAELSLRY